MRDLLSRLKAGDVIVADGAIGSLLLERGLPQGQCPEFSNLSQPEVLEEIAERYLDAGAEIIQANTFGATPLKLSRYGLEERVDEVNRRAVEAVRRVAGDRAYVAGSCGPTGRTLKPYGDTDPEDVNRAFETQIRILVDAGVDLLCIETMTDLTEARLAVQAAKRIASAIPVTATMTFDKTPRGYFTIMGVSIESAASGLADAGADVVGSNCGNGIENMVEIARDFKKHSPLPLIVQPNAGLPVLEGDTTIYPETPEFMAERAKPLLEIGVSILGGCCGTTPEHTRAMRKAVDAAMKRT